MDGAILIKVFIWWWGLVYYGISLNFELRNSDVSLYCNKSNPEKERS